MAKPLPMDGPAADPVSLGTRQACPSQKLAIIIPTLYEAGNIQDLLERLVRSLDPLGIAYELIVVDDDSQDGTAAIVDKFAQLNPRVRMLVRKSARGLAGAVVHGWQNTDAGILGVIDADLQHPPELLPKLWQALQSGADVVVGSRYASAGHRPNWNRLRHLVSQLAIWMTLPLQEPGIRVLDPMSGFFLVRRSCIQGIDFQTQGFKILLEILVRGNLRSASEVPFTFGRRHAGQSKASLRVGIEYLRLLAKLWRKP